MKPRGSMLRQLAERAAMHPSIETAVLGAIRLTLPSVLEQLIAEEAERQGSHILRIYGRRMPSERRSERDAKVRELLLAGKAPEHAALEAGCSRAHAFKVQAALRLEIQSKSVP